MIITIGRSHWKKGFQNNKMIIKELFKKDISRNIEGVVTIGNEDASRKKQELEEYVCTKEIQENLGKFFGAYRKSIQSPTTAMGVWITGFFGSGKSHFLKILGYLLSNEIVDGKHAIDYFKDKISDSTIYADMGLASRQNNLVILFNIDNKAMSNAKSKQDSIMETMLNCFNEKIGYSGTTAWVAQMERSLDEEGNYETFKSIFKDISKRDWSSITGQVFFFRDSIIKALSQSRNMSEESARKYFDDAQRNFALNIDMFAKIITDYCNKTKKRVVFLMDEIGQFIGSNPSLMLGLQTVVEELGKQANGRAWVVITSQQEIDSLIENMRENDFRQADFSKIQGRFATRLLLSSSNADEVIKKRLLDKKEDAKNYLSSIYNRDKNKINNLLVFPLKPKWCGYEDEEQFIDDYPFVNYQYELLQKSFTSIRESGLTEGKAISSGERSLLSAFQNSAKKHAESEVELLVPFNDFYDTAEEFMDYNIKQVFSSAKRRVDDGTLQSFDIEVLKVLFMLKNVKEMEPTIDRLGTLMISSLNEDKLALKHKIKESLDRLIGETLVQQNGERYDFLTNEEQDCNRQISRTNYQESDIRNTVREIVFDTVLGVGKTYSYMDGRYNFSLNKFVDNTLPGNENPEGISVKIITPLLSDIEYSDTNMQTDSMGDNLIINLRNGSYINELISAAKITTYYRNNIDSASSNVIKILQVKQKEAEERVKRAQDIIRTIFATAPIYQNGALLEAKSSKPKDRFDDGMKSAINSKFNKLEYIKSFVTNSKDVASILRSQPSTLTDIFDASDNSLALKEIIQKIKDNKSILKKTSLSGLISDLKRKPYGWKSIDVRAQVATLLLNDKIIIKYQGEVCNIHSADFINRLCTGENDEYYVLEVKEKISDETLYAVKQIFKEAFDMTIEKKESALFDETRQFFKDKLEKLNAIKVRGETSYPGKLFVESTSTLFNGLVNTTDSSSLFKKIIDNKDRLNEIGCDLDNILNFYEQGNRQRETWNQAENISKFYDDNMLLVDGLDCIADDTKQINEILVNPMPFNLLPKLSRLTIKVKNQIDSLENERKEAARKVIKENYKKIQDEASVAVDYKFNNPEKKEELEKYIQAEKSLFENQLLRWIDNSIKIDACKSKSFEEVDTFRKHIDEIIRSDQLADKASKGKKIKTITMSDLVPVASKRITCDEDIESILKHMKEYLEHLLIDNDEIDIK